MQTFTPKGRLRGPILPVFVLRQNISPGAKLLYSVICNHAGAKDHCWPSHKLLAQEMGYSVSSIKNWLAELVRARLLRISRNAWRSSTYTLLSPTALTAPAASSPEPKFDYPQAKFGYRNNSRNILEIPPSPPQRTRRDWGKRRDRSGGGGGDFLSANQAFEKFFAAYPRHEAKEAARAVWHQLRRTGCLPDMRALLASLAAFQSSAMWQREHGRFVPYLVNWLRARRWLDAGTPDPEAARVIPPQAALQQAMRRLEAQRQDPDAEAARPLFEAFLGRFSPAARVKRGPAWGLWSRLHRQGNAPTAEDVQEHTRQEVFAFLQGWQRGCHATA